MGAAAGEGGGGQGLSPEELECKICYSPYSLRGRRPKLLACCHRLCSRCLAKMADLAEAEAPPYTVVCPFCRCVTGLPDEATGSVPDDGTLVTALALRNQTQTWRSPGGSTELLLSPARLGPLLGGGPTLPLPPSASAYASIRSSPNFVVITIMEPPPPSPRPHLRSPSPLGGASVTGYRSPSPGGDSSMQCSVWSCAVQLGQAAARGLVWALGLLWLLSLPLGVYLLITQRTGPGAALASLLPASLLLVTLYGFCQCLWQELWDACRGQGVINME